MSTETFAFQAEINQLLSLIINTFYSNKDVFLRELLSNASDALDKIRYQSLTNADVLQDNKDLAINITADKENKTLTIADNGIGMTREDLVANLGTIAHSGTKSFIENITKSGSTDLSLIGQFGVGFYSAFLVADKVAVYTKHNDDDSYLWESSASGTFTITKMEEEMPRGTKIVLHLKEDQQQYLQESVIRNIVSKHSQYNSFPISLEVEVEEEQSSEEKVEEEGEVTEKQETKKIMVKKWDRLNKLAPIWTRKPEEVTVEEYNQFYKNISNDWDSPLMHRHFSVDGNVQFKSVLYIPQRAPMDMFNAERQRSNIKLYVKKVLILEETNNLLPEYLSFVQGVIDSDDLPLNVSREMLQQNSIMNIIKKNITKKVIEMFTELASENGEKWKTFYQQFNKNLKIAVIEDHKNRSKFTDLLRFYTSKSGDEMVSFQDYISRMKEGQKDIYYLAGESKSTVEKSPFAKALSNKGFEVIYFVDPIDEYMASNIRDVDEKTLTDCTRDGLQLPMTEEEKTALEEKKKVWTNVCDKMKEHLGDKVVTVQISSRLTDTPCILVSDKYGITANMERIMKAQTISNSAMGMMGVRKIFEINTDHPMVKEIKQRIEASKDISGIVDILYETACIDSGFGVSHPSVYANKIYKIMMAGLLGQVDDEPASDDVEVEEKEAVGDEDIDIEKLSMEELD